MGQLSKSDNATKPNATRITFENSYFLLEGWNLFTFLNLTPACTKTLTSIEEEVKKRKNSPNNQSLQEVKDMLSDIDWDKPAPFSN